MVRRAFRAKEKNLKRDRPGELIHIDIKKLGRFERTGHRITGDRTGQSKSRGIGEFRPGLDPDVAINALYGPIYYRLLTSTGPLDEAFAARLAGAVMRGIAV